MMSPDISIIIPCYNRVSLLKETLASVKAAINSLNAEIILVDDGSVPPIEEQLEDFKELPLKFLKQANSGLTTSRYNGLMQASGDFIQFLDSDDQIASDKLVLQIQRMKETGADVSHTDVLHTSQTAVGNDDKTGHISYFRDSTNPAEFYIDIQPAPHSPIFSREYLINTLKTAFIPLSREYDSIGEIWFYYNLSPFPAKIIKVDGPHTVCINHNEERITNHWERLGLCALTLQLNFVKHHPKDTPFSDDACRFVGKAAFNTYRGLPYNIYAPFQKAFIKIWKALGKTTHVGGGKYFNLASKIIGPEVYANLYRRISNNKYEPIRTIDQNELIQKTHSILNNHKLN